ncbi:Gldg family protein [Rubinisphaera sp.]|uniref:Gldg family protein n=1 Tax=Rubinisphaera sp. TaxID=2024857 RepID=UPI000C0DFDB6|nr:Gldg family protein [Rubinisphaera sp.]MBV11057.1 ABC transporter permease [Rubinisphaera sp.]|tara:strand:+ start:3575 stop:6322 length:2748 start_codon:yes stop_codon:yes gene_type:complete
MIRGHVIHAVFSRNLAGFFSGLLGYVVIVAFVVIAASLAFSADFFASNHATLDQLTANFPALLVFLIPALTMTCWADERKMGTDELLFTMPATDLEILIGKYLAILAVYTVGLLFSCTNLIMLSVIGNPDPGVQFTTYVGYWLAGASLISAGMLASALTSHSAVAFVVGAIFCCVPVFISLVANVVTSGVAAFLRTFGMSSEKVAAIIPQAGAMDVFTISHHLSDFALGILPLAGMVYFFSLISLFLYLNYVVISRRHWNTGEENNSMGWQFSVRSISLAIALMSITTLAIGSVSRFDFTQRSLYTLSTVTSKVIKELDAERPVTIQAFISPQVPEEYSAVHQNLVGTLRELAHRGGSKINVRITNVEPFSEEAEQARLLGITSRSVQTERNGEIKIEEIFMGVRISSGLDEVVIPFFDLGNSVEYELTRSLRTVSRETRLTVGILKTDASVAGGFDSATFRSQPEWRIVTELKKQYNIEEISPDSPIDESKFDVLLAILPSSLTEPQLENLVTYVATGNPTLIFDDPMPMFNINMAPRMEKPPQGGGMMGQQMPSEPKADGGKLTSLLGVMEVVWENGEIVFDRDSPYPKIEDMLGPEAVFVYDKRKARDAFNPDDQTTAGLQQMLIYYSGTVVPRESETMEFTPLLRSGAANSGILNFDSLIIRNPLFGMTLNNNPRRDNDEFSHVVAARVKSKAADKESGNNPVINAIFVADIDLISDGIFDLAERQSIQALGIEMKLDNIKFVLNCVDSLAGEEDFISLRNRRDDSRTLDWVETLTSGAVEKRSAAEKAARTAEEERLADANQELRDKIAELEKDTTMDELAKLREIQMLQSALSRKVEVDTVDIERESEAEIQAIKASSEREIAAVKGQFRFWAIVLPPLPAILLGLIIGFSRVRNERRMIIDERRVNRA